MLDEIFARLLCYEKIGKLLQGGFEYILAEATEKEKISLKDVWTIFQCQSQGVKRERKFIISLAFLKTLISKTI